MAENFDLIFGQNASQQYAWNDTDYQNGWETIGNIPPTAAQFDALQRRSDAKMKELNDELTPLVNANQTDSRQPSTAYSEGDVKYSPLLPTGWFLECTISGMSSASELVIPSLVAEGDSITDGTVVWTICKIGSADLSTCANTDLSNLTAAGEAKITSLPYERDFTIIYPNGGSKANPANISKNERYLESNPFPGYYVTCLVEFLISNEWGGPGGWVYGQGSSGTNASQFNDNSIAVVTGTATVFANRTYSGNAFGVNQQFTSLPCRVKVWKIGKIPD